MCVFCLFVVLVWFEPFFFFLSLVFLREWQSPEHMRLGIDRPQGSLQDTALKMPPDHRVTHTWATHLGSMPSPVSWHPTSHLTAGRQGGQGL